MISQNYSTSKLNFNFFFFGNAKIFFNCQESCSTFEEENKLFRIKFKFDSGRVNVPFFKCNFVVVNP